MTEVSRISDLSTNNLSSIREIPPYPTESGVVLTRSVYLKETTKSPDGPVRHLSDRLNVPFDTGGREEKDDIWSELERALNKDKPEEMTEDRRGVDLDRRLDTQIRGSRWTC